MSTDINQATVSGRLGRDPELKQSKSGTAVLSFSMASNSWNSATSQEVATWHKVVVFGKSAEGLGKFLAKGAKVFVTGRIDNSTYEKEGVKRTSSKIIAHQVVVASSKGDPGAAAEEDDDIPF